LRLVLTAMPAFVRAALAIMFQYRGEMLLWAIWGVVYPAVAMAMWSAAIAGTEGGTEIRGFTQPDFAAYFIWTMVVGHLCTAWDVYELGYFVRSGGMSPKLLRPLLPVWESVAANLAYKVLTTVILAPIWIVVALLTRPHFEGGFADLALGGIATILGALLNFVWGYVLALSAFWFTRSEAVGQLWFGSQLFFGGRLAPLTILPPVVQWAAAFLPLKWIIWFPATVLLGRTGTREVVQGLIWQIVWLAAGVVAFRAVWSRGVRRYSAVGA